jgi:hypothetical protein
MSPETRCAKSGDVDIDWDKGVGASRIYAVLDG